MNHTSKPLTEVHFTLANDYETTIEMPGRDARPGRSAVALSDLPLTTPLQPGESRVMQFTMKTQMRGFENSLTNRAVLQNGTFIHSRIVPQIGYQDGNELTTRTSASASG